MNLYHNEIENEIRSLHARIIEERQSFHEGLRQNIHLADLRKLYNQIKDLEKRLDFCFEESNALRNR
jgi:hypothetical protein